MMGNEFIHSLAERAREIRSRVANSGIPVADAEVVTAVLTMMDMQNPAQQIDTASAPDNMPPLTFAEWAAEMPLESHRDKCIAAAYWLLEQERREEFNTDEIMILYQHARWAKPANPADVVGKAANVRLLSEVRRENVDPSGKKQWRLTRTGIQHFRGFKKEEVIDGQ